MFHPASCLISFLELLKENALLEKISRFEMENENNSVRGGNQSCFLTLAISVRVLMSYVNFNFNCCVLVFCKLVYVLF